MQATCRHLTTLHHTRSLYDQHFRVYARKAACGVPAVQALTTTVDGDAVVWDEQGITAQMGTRATDRRASKVMRLHEAAIPFLGAVGDYVVTGGADGLVRFYDPMLRITAWFEDMDAGAVTAVSIAAKSHKRTEQEATQLNRYELYKSLCGVNEGCVVLSVYYPCMMYPNA